MQVHSVARDKRTDARAHKKEARYSAAALRQCKCAYAQSQFQPTHYCLSYIRGAARHARLFLIEKMLNEK